MITAIVQYCLPSSIDLKACAEHFRKIAPGFRAVPGAHPQAVHLCRGQLGRRRVSVEDARRRGGVLFGSVARRHPRGFWPARTGAKTV